MASAIDDSDERDRWARLLQALDQLSAARTMDELVESIRSSARVIAKADGITVVRREGDFVHYIAEDAISPLWTGQRFPINQCISGHAMLDGQPIILPDIEDDPRVPLNAYLSTFARSLAMFPVGIGEPVAAIGAYWAQRGAVDQEAVTLLSMMARAAGAVIEQIDVVATVSLFAERLGQASASR